MRLTDSEIQTALASLDDWSFLADRGGLIQKTFVFEDFQSAFTFMTSMARESEAMNHHPEWRNIYNRVEITLTTHDAGGLTQKDLDWASAADAAGARGTEGPQDVEDAGL